MTNSSSWVGRSLVIGFACAIAVWVSWFITHLPWLALSEPTRLPIVLGVWIVAAMAGSWWSGRSHAVRIGAVAGLVSALLGLLILGSKLSAPASAGSTGGAIPSAPLIAIGFLLLGVIIGLFGGVVAHFAAPARDHQGSNLPTFAVVALFAVAPLLFVGGLVTSTNSGMAVPDWPNTYGSNMFLYPLGPRIDAGPGSKLYEDIYFEHAHRLFGTLVGVTTLTLAVWVFRQEKRRWVLGVAAAAIILVILQGVLGGVRVLGGSVETAADLKAGRWYSMGHGILAQLCFGVLVALAVYLAPSYRNASAADIDGDSKMARNVKLMATALMHTLILQLIFGAMYRHLRSPHALWSHVAFSFVVMLIAIGAGFMFTSLTGKLGQKLSRLGWGLVGVVLIQFALGWTAFLIGSKDHKAGSIVEALVRTTHQANGALLLALATAGFVWARQVWRVSSVETPNAPVPG